MKHFEEYILNEFLVNHHTQKSEDSYYDIPEEYKEIKGNRVRCLGKVAVTKDGNETIWYRIWKYFGEHHETTVRDAWKELGFPEGYYTTILRTMLLNNMLVKGGPKNKYYQAVHPQYWKNQK